MDQINIYGLEVFAHHGVYEFETQNGQLFMINAKLFSDLRQAGRLDELTLSTHYGEVCQFLTDFLQINTYHLIEAAAEQAVRSLLLNFPLIREVELELCKPQAPIGLPFQNVSVTIRRKWTEVFIAYGSNRGNPDEQIARGLEAFANTSGVRLLAKSDTVTTKPYGGVEQADFRNGVVKAETLLSPLELLDRLHEIEASEGRDRAKEQRWGPRPLDLDILAYGEEIWNTEALTLPHPDMQNRDFVLAPLVQIAPWWRHPIFGKSATKLLAELERGK